MTSCEMGGDAPLDEWRLRTEVSSNRNKMPLSPKEGGVRLLPARSAPLSDLVNLPATPRARSLSPSSPPSLLPATPGQSRPTVHRSANRKRLSVPRTPRTPLVKVHTAVSPSTPSVSALPTTSFYSKPSPSSAPGSGPVPATREPRRAVGRGRRGSLGKHRSKTSSGRKRKGGPMLGGGGVGHNIKRPKLARPGPATNISALPAVPVELPGRKPATPARPAPSPATHGQITVSSKAKVQFEVKGGQFVYRAKAKTAITPRSPATPTTALRRSPRKHFSPLKEDYFSNKKTDTFSPTVKPRKSGKLFSPTGNFLKPERETSKTVLPSPVKFESGEPNTDLTDLISSLARDQAIEVELPVSSLPAPPGMPDVSTAISNILNDLSSGEEEDGGNTTASSVASPFPVPQQAATKLFPIFYKNPESEKNTVPSPSVPTTARPSKRFLCSSLADNQQVIDAGQAKLGAVVCPTCGGVYSLGDPEDEAQHAAQHSGLLAKLKLPGWKTERVVGEFPAGRVICVRPDDHQNHWRKAEEVLAVADQELGFSEVGIRWPDKSKVFLFLADKKVVGLLLAESIQQAFPLLPSEGSGEGGRVYYSSSAGQPVLCGVSRIWVLADYRRAGVASSLVDCMRASFFQNHYLQPSEFAFSDPTPSGIKFASQYMGSEEFLVYNR